MVVSPKYPTLKGDGRHHPLFYCTFKFKGKKVYCVYYVYMSGIVIEN